MSAQQIMSFSVLSLSVRSTLCDTMECSPLFVGFSRLEYWSGLPFLSPGDIPDPGIEPTFSVSLALAGRFFTTEPSGKQH